MPSQKPAKPITRASLERAALRYLSQRGASRAQLASNLRRRVQRAIARGDELGTGETDGWIEEVLDRMESWGYLDDPRFARSKTRSMRQSGASRRKIESRLMQKGIDRDVIKSTLGDEPDQTELEAAQRLVERRRFGRNPERKQKELAALARAGFSYGIARTALERSDVD